MNTNKTDNFQKLLSDMKKETNTCTSPTSTFSAECFSDDESTSNLEELQISLDLEEKPMEEEWISLSMDGKIFTTTRCTLCSDKESVLYTMFKKDSRFTLKVDESHPSKPFLFDRNPKYFEPVLSYFRTGHIIIDDDVNLLGVLLEAKYFNIKALVKEVSKILKQKERLRKLELNKSELTRDLIVKALITCQSGSANLRFQGLNLTGLDLSGLDLSGINFQRSNLTGVNLSNCTLDGADFSDCILEDADLSNATLRKAKIIKADLKRANLVGANLQSTDFRHSNLTEACLRSCDLTDSNMSNSILLNSDISFANLKGTDLTRSVLTGINRQGANLSMGGVIRTNSK